MQPCQVKLENFTFRRVYATNRLLMKQEFWKNSALAKKLGVSHTSIARWIEEATNKNNNLQLVKTDGRQYILDNDHNEAELLQLKAKAFKYRNKIGYERIEVDSELYTALNYSQLVELITSLENQRKIPLKFSYLNAGAKAWHQFVQANSQNGRSYMSETNILIETNLEAILYRLKSYNLVNIVDVGPGDGHTTKPIIEKLLTEGLEVRYNGIDVSPKMNEILAEEMKFLLPETNISIEIGDMDYLVIRDKLFNSKLNYANSCNLILLVGSTIGNVEDRHRVLKNFNTSMGKDDFFLLDNGLNVLSWRTNFDSLDNPFANKIIKWIPEKLGLTGQNTEAENRYDEKSKSRIQVLRLQKDLDIVFNLNDLEKVVSLPASTEITIWNHYSHKLKDLQAELEEAGFEIEHLSVYPDRSHVLVLCELPKSEMY